MAFVQDIIFVPDEIGQIGICHVAQLVVTDIAIDADTVEDVTVALAEQGHQYIDKVPNDYC